MSDLLSQLGAALAGRYEIVRELGEGGTATVYLAEDLKHERKVALKVLKPTLAEAVGAERFLGEIRTTANLQHPNILPLFDSGEADGLIFYVMPWVQGESLRDLLDRERQLPVVDAVSIASDLAGALDYAHRQGIVHRDLKPANVLLLDGKPVIADFGIALAAGAATRSRLTETGLSLGTPFYMSPEQASGDEVIGPASDLFSLGCVLYEMLAGEPPYRGASPQAIIAKVLTAEPAEVRKVRSAVPPNADAVIRKCLERVPADRFRTAGEVARALADPGFRHGAIAVGGAQTPNRWWVGTVVLLSLALVWALATRPGGSPNSDQVTTFSLAIAPGAEPTTGFDVSDDGRMIVLALPQGTDGVELGVRRLDEPRFTRLAGTAPGGAPTISPDGRSVVYYAGEQLRIVEIESGEVRTLVPALYAPADWGDDGFLYFTSRDGGIARVHPSGESPPEPLTDGSDDGPHRDVHVLPGSDAFLYTRLGRPAPEIWVHDLQMATSARVTVGGRPTLTATGHLVFGTTDGLKAVPFDPETGSVSGTEFTVIENITTTGLGIPYYALSDDGLLVYWRGGFSDDEFVWVDRAGAARPVEAGWSFEAGDANQGWDLSPDGRRIVYRAVGPNGSDIRVKEIGGGPATRLTFGGPPVYRPRWNPDGRRVTFGQRQGSVRRLWEVPFDGSSEPIALNTADVEVSAGYRSPDPDRLVLRATGLPNTRGGRDIFTIRPDVDSVATPIVAGPDEETGPEVSRDGRWIAYVSDATGQYEVFVRPFDEGKTGRWQVSSAGGTMPLWAHNGREMFYVDLEHRVVAVSIDPTDGFRVTGERVLYSLGPSFATRLYRATGGLWDITPEDDRFLMVRRRTIPEEERPELVVIQNFLTTLTRPRLD